MVKMELFMHVVRTNKEIQINKKGVKIDSGVPFFLG